MNIRTFVAILSRNPQYDFPKMRGGSKVVWNFSENSSVLVGPFVPYLLMLCHTLILPSSTSCFSHTSTAFFASSLSSLEAECLRQVHLTTYIRFCIWKKYTASLPSSQALKVELDLIILFMIIDIINVKVSYLSTWVPWLWSCICEKTHAWK